MLQRRMIAVRPDRWWRSNHYPLDLGPITNADKARFFAKIAEPDENGCMIWTASCFLEGYGKFKLNGRNVKAHRVAWTIANGAIPDDQLVLHLVCDNPPCCNVAHLDLGDHQLNSDDMIAKGRKAYLFGEQNGQAVLTELQVREIYRLACEGTYFQREIGEMFGVTFQMVSAIKHRKWWSHLWQNDEGGQ